MGKLYENELTKTLLNLMEHFVETGLLPKFLDAVGIAVPPEELGAPSFDSLKFLPRDEVVDWSRREIDGVIAFDSTLVFIEAKRSPNKFDKKQLIDEFRLGAKIAGKKRSFYLLAIDESVVEPAVIETVRRSSYAKIKKEQIKWISWHEITKLLSDLYGTHSFEGPVAKRIFGGSLTKFKEQGFGGFEGFSKEDTRVVSRAGEYLAALNAVNNEILNFVKQIQIELSSNGIARLHHVTEHWRTGKGKKKGKRKKIKKKTYRVDWEQRSVGIGHRTTSVAVSYLFPFADKDWSYDLRESNLDYCMYLEFDLLASEVAVGYLVRKLKNIKNALSKKNKVHQALTSAKFCFFDRRPLTVIFHRTLGAHSEPFPAKGLEKGLLESLTGTRELRVEYRFDALDDRLMSRTQGAFLAIRDLVNGAEMLPILELKPGAEAVSLEVSEADDDITDLADQA